MGPESIEYYPLEISRTECVEGYGIAISSPQGTAESGDSDDFVRENSGGWGKLERLPEGGDVGVMPS